MKVKQLIDELEQYRAAHNGDDHLVVMTSYDYSDNVGYIRVGSDCNAPYIELMGDSVTPNNKRPVQ